MVMVAGCAVARADDVDPLGAPTSSQLADAAPDVRECVEGETRASQVSIYGDSYLRRTGAITSELVARARRDGALGWWERYRDYSLNGASLTGLFSLDGVLDIPSQHRWARRWESDIRAVIMTGGGNDVLMNNRVCLWIDDPASEPYCQRVVADTAASLDGMMQEMAADGVEDVVYFFYPGLPGGGLGGRNPNAILNYAYPLMQAVCEAQTGLRCHFIDTRPAFAGHPEYIDFDGVHPSDAGSRVIAELIWQTMVDGCIAQ